MKPIAIILLALVLIGAAWASTGYVSRSAAQLTDSFTELQGELERGNWAAAGAALAKAEARWQKIKPFWQALVDHRELDSIEQSLARMKKSAELQNRHDSLSELAVLQKIIEHIPERGSMQLGNLL